MRCSELGSASAERLRHPPKLVAWRQATQVSRQGLAGHVLAGPDPCSLHHPLGCSPQLAMLECLLFASAVFCPDHKQKDT